MKFGGASVKDADSIRNVAQIMEQYAHEPVVVVISASGKTTNHLEELAFLARDGKEEAAREQFKRIQRFHLQLMKDLFPETQNDVLPEAIRGYFEEMERIVSGILLLEEFPPRTYDRIVSYGELLSTTIVAEYLKAQGKDVIWADARHLVRTDANYQQAGVIWSLTDEAIRREVWPQLKPGRILITQGFIGSTTDGRTTTLGREGSDYTASIFATCLGAKSLTVWKDVPGILNADPRLRQDTLKLDHLSYEEAVEMTFYGATVIHPKTIKPIYNKHIPLHVKCFYDTSLPGTSISTARNAETITSYIVKNNQVFIRIQPKDFSFMEERLMQQVFDHIYKSGVKVSLVQNSAISLMLCLDDTPGAIGAFESLLIDLFELEKKEGLKLYTVINFAVKDLKEAARAVMVQQHDNKLFIVK